MKLSTYKNWTGTDEELKVAVEAHITQYGQGAIWNLFVVDYPKLVDLKAPAKVNSKSGVKNPKPKASKLKASEPAAKDKPKQGNGARNRGLGIEKLLNI